MDDSLSLPKALEPVWQHQWERWCAAADDTQREAVEAHLSDEIELRNLQRVFVGSEFMVEQCCKDSALLPAILACESFESFCEFFSDPSASVIPESDETFDRALRRYRNRALCWIIYSDWSGRHTIETCCALISQVAEHTIQKALAWHSAAMHERNGVPRNADGEVQPLLVLGMGKLGAGELNLSSDIDLIFAYPESGACDGDDGLDNQAFFTRLGQRLIRSLDAVTADGFVFRVDMRLRPYGDSGPLVKSFAAMEDYYQTQGREWERYAMVKARVVADDSADDSAGDDSDNGAVAELMELLRPFTYRRYIDFSVIEALREMKSLINREVARRNLGDNIKLGRGGIREVEFIAQVFQLIRGGTEVELRERNLLKVLPMLVERGFLGKGMDRALSDAYRLLRRVEHALQAFRDRQTQTLPAEEDARARLAFVLGFLDWAQLEAALAEARELIHAEFQAVVAAPEDQQQPDRVGAWRDFWASFAQMDQDLEEPARARCAVLQLAGYDNVDKLQDQLHDLSNGPTARALPAQARDRLDQFMPMLLAELEGTPAPHVTLERILPLVRAILRRSAYLTLINENPVVLEQLVRLCGASPLIAAQLARHPLLLDELLDARRLLRAPDAEEIEAELRRDLLRVPDDDLEAQMEALRHFKLGYDLRVAAQEVSGVLPLMKVSDALTWLAEAILKYSLQIAWQQMVEKYGLPAGASEDDVRFCIVAYGKLGGLELGHGSDLDLVFVHDTEPYAQTSGDHSLDNATFYTRLGQRLIHILQTRTFSGPLYEVDTRLRPSGNSGLLVTSLEAFERYQRKDAWTWEHQALVRARPVAGSQMLCEKFESLRADILCQPRDEKELREEVVSMRNKMREHLDKSLPDKGFDLKQGSGGIVDIEFLVQYSVLAGAHQAPATVRYTDNIRILGCLEEAGLMPAHQAADLIDAYKAFRSQGHRLALQQQPGIVDDGHFTAEKKTVQALWQQYLGESRD
ncbi:bifunctional [glutamate--ammonia ligase]-adenylyl-L-tyrosine phosphorylase/[glutamate--ammonia-ligase] adenylyltransferase [Biformimicrobium ophioploci]|uniref:Bifunctional glutamine synthetase adenylyltransferase/adenylyl-removing enzyme n=1 Tax=Biformimicrobium ophioploci TaxID=3036711 RepID=A0ABQ6M0P4_9GAMM|nr:bifunctional [glutamate--ammonia ligase]-adenylyl-L-tyrosine phosphorylase/[glutamate--ammonia-ligase] adenylyltransferase [Microbulbifer sp. NKW57]GMG87874.1 bifunctional [glutamate--ammonia ligase]-adenylyl-L-tyrosine phosphorylase/[glutamate--ammonia-ligase] adenylyltransferase [Microbulbifer sp. NKW57]